MRATGGAMSTLGKRLAKARKLMKLSQKEMAARFGVGWRSIQDYEQDQAMPGGKVLTRYAEVGVDVNEILLGVESTPLSGSGQHSLQSNIISIRHLNPQHAGNDESQGYEGRCVLGLDEKALQQMLVRASLNDSDIRSLRTTDVLDDQMQPTLSRGDTIVFASTGTVPASGLYVIRTPSGLMARRVQVLTDGTLQIFSDNPAYRSETISPSKTSDVHIIGHLVCRVG